MTPITPWPSPVRITVQAVLAVIGMGLFIWLIFLLLDGRTGGLQVVLLLLILVIEILLVEPVFRHLTSSQPRPPVSEADETYGIGCPGCGTVFTLGASNVERGEFSCENRGRPGFVVDHDLNTQEIRREMCNTCGATYFEYHEHSECPQCHTFNAY